MPAPRKRSLARPANFRGLATGLLRKTLGRAGLKLSRLPVNEPADYRRLYSADAVADRRFYNVGAGSFLHPHWTNLDVATDWYACVQRGFTTYDLMTGGRLPIESSTAEIIYTSHTIEHVTERAVERLFRNAFKALKSGGIFRITTGPDADLDFAALKRGDAEWFYWDDAPFDAHYRSIHRDPPNTRPIEERWLHHVASQLAPNDRSPSPVKFAAPEIRRIIAERGKIGALDYFTSLCTFQPERIGNHISWWNADKLVDRLRKAGFENVYRSGYGQSAAAVLRDTQYFDNTHPAMSVYVEAVR